MKKLDMGYKNLAPMTFSFEESQEIAAAAANASAAIAAATGTNITATIKCAANCGRDAG